MKRLFGAIGWLGVVLVVAAVVLRVVRPEAPQWSQRLALAGLVVTLLYGLTQWRDIARSFQGRNVKYGSIAASSVVLVLGILVGLNWIASRQNKRWDLTAAGQFSLSDQTKKILAELKQPLTIRAFYTGVADQYRDRLKEYEYASSQVSTEFIDAERNPLEAQKREITTVPTFLIEYAGRTERASSDDEQSLTNALKKVIEGKAKKAYFVQGHGEKDPTASDPNGYSGIADALKTDNFDVAPLTLAQQGSVPDDATLLVIAGPKTDLLQGEIDAVKAFLARGGKVALLIDPPDKGTAPDVSRLIALAEEWGVDVGNDLVVDASGLGQLIGTDASVPIAMPVAHPITENFRVMTAFPLARSVAPVEGGRGGHVPQKVLETSPQSWAESDLESLYSTGRPSRDPDKGDKAGPVSIAAAVSAAATNAPAAPADAAPDAPKPETRVVVVGDSDFASNRALGIQGNRDLFLNMANWLAQQEDLIAIRPRSPESRPLTMTADQQAMVFWFTMVIVPLLLIGNGVRVWWKKR
ncbi:MAG: GldG family protein [Acidobacteria bacterium]|nr:GldG family protein [Acidobacteriota bacterium]